MSKQLSTNQSSIVGTKPNINDENVTPTTESQAHMYDYEERDYSGTSTNDNQFVSDSRKIALSGRNEYPYVDYMRDKLDEITLLMRKSLDINQNDKQGYVYLQQPNANEKNKPKQPLYDNVGYLMYGGFPDRIDMQMAARLILEVIKQVVNKNSNMNDLQSYGNLMPVTKNELNATRKQNEMQNDTQSDNYPPVYQNVFEEGRRMNRNPIINKRGGYLGATSDEYDKSRNNPIVKDSQKLALFGGNPAYPNDDYIQDKLDDISLLANEYLGVDENDNQGNVYFQKANPEKNARDAKDKHNTQPHSDIGYIMYDGFPDNIDKETVRRAVSRAVNQVVLDNPMSYGLRTHDEPIPVTKNELGSAKIQREMVIDARKDIESMLQKPKMAETLNEQLCPENNQEQSLGMSM